MANNERSRGDQDFNRRPAGIVIPLEELKPLTSEDERVNELIVATPARNVNDISGVEDGLNNNRNISYTAKKNFSQGMMDIALLTANASQLRYVMRSPYWDFYHKMNITLISISIALQIIAGILLVCVSRKDYKRKDVREGTRIMNDLVVILIFAITFVNIFIATFGIDDERTTFLRWKQTATDIPSEPHSPTGV
ncbi:ninjurin-1-like [Daphnia carinata]|uniref:ninjurin-1-like n=1 Tax=Daphnia carinata TaxID=120202 RepID=UPI00257ED30F|nr:ninjurin-1-like [Daphnia carinata]